MSSKKAKAKNKSPKIKVPRPWIADVVGCSERMVRKVLNTKDANADTDLATNIELADILLDEKIATSISEVKNIVHKSKK